MKEDVALFAKTYIVLISDIKSVSEKNFCNNILNQHIVIKIYKIKNSIHHLKMLQITQMLL